MDDNVRQDEPERIPDFSNTERDRVPGEFLWKIEDVYPDLDAWERDKALYVRMIDRIDELAVDWTHSHQRLFALLDHVTQIQKLEEKIYCYPRLLADTDMGNSKWQAIKGEIQCISIQMESKLAFMEPDLLELGKETIERYRRAEPRLDEYAMYFDSMLRMKDYILSTDKERILSQTALFSGASKKGADMLNDVEMPAPRLTLSDGKKVRLNIPAYVRHRESNVRSDRHNVMETFWKNHAKFRNTHAALLDGAIKSHWFFMKVRGYKSCLQAALYPHNIKPDVYDNLIQTVRENLKPLHRYLQLKARILNIDKLSYNDIYASSVPSIDKTYPIADAKTMVCESLHPLGDSYTDLLKQAFESGWMDIYANKAKRSGAYSMGVYNVHPFVLMNYNGTFSHVSTLAHEFGHALHSWFSDTSQPYKLAQYPIFLAEIASTFNENLLTQYMLRNETDDLFKLYILDRYLEEIRGTLFRQTLFSEFELDMHREVEAGRTLTADWLDNRYLELTRYYYGHGDGIMDVPDPIKNEWSGIPHFYYYFYVYQYSTGIAASSALAETVLNGSEADAQRYLRFLKRGGSLYPLDTLKEAGVDLTSPTPILITIRKFDQIVSEMEAIVNRQGQ
ncbi:MAG: oligoendopeptidase F [Candidatus Omnitrophota bacterium]